MEHRKDIRTAPRRSSKSRKYERRNNQRTSSQTNRDRSIRERRSRKNRSCHDTQRCKGIGAVLFTLGIPASIAGLILTVVAATDDDTKNKYPPSFIAVGPILLVLAVICFCSGICLYSTYVGEIMRRLFSLEEPSSFCRVHCPKFSQFLKPDDSIAINQAGMKALQTEPGKPVLKRNRLPTVTSEDGIMNEDATVRVSSSMDSCGGNSHISSKGVRFSESDIEDKDQSANSTDSVSILSLRHCKISPKTESDTIWWTNEEAGIAKIQQSNGDIAATTEL